MSDRIPTDAERIAFLEDQLRRARETIISFAAPAGSSPRLDDVIENAKRKAVDELNALDWHEGDLRKLNIIERAIRSVVEPFTVEEWHDISLCVGWTVAMSDGNDEPSKGRRAHSMRALAAMTRVFGAGFHARIAGALDSPNAPS